MGGDTERTGFWLAVGLAAGITAASEAAIFTAVASYRTAEVAVAPAGGDLVFTGPADGGSADWYGSTFAQAPAYFVTSSHGSGVGPNLISAVGEIYANGAGTGHRIAARSAFELVFTLDEAADVTLLAQAGFNFGTSSLLVRLADAHGTYLDASAPFTEFRTLSLAAGTYFLTAFVTTELDGTVGSANGFFTLTMTVPGPGAPALLGLAGLVGSRRRRR